MKRFVLLRRTAVVIGFLVFWELFYRSGLINPLLLASPLQVLNALFTSDRRLLTAFGTTVGEIVVAVLIASIAGVGVGLAVGSDRRLSSAVTPLLSALFSVPKIMWYPLLLVWCGIGPSSKIVYGILTGFFPIALATIDAVHGLDARLVATVQSFGATRSEIALKVAMPLALPGIISGVRIGATLIAIGVVVAEMLSAFNGLGFWISYNRTMFNTPQIYLGIVLALLCTGTLSALFSYLEQRFGGWRDLERSV